MAIEKLFNDGFPHSAALAVDYNYFFHSSDSPSSIAVCLLFYTMTEIFASVFITSLGMVLTNVGQML